MVEDWYQATEWDPRPTGGSFSPEIVESSHAEKRAAGPQGSAWRCGVADFLGGHVAIRWFRFYVEIRNRDIIYILYLNLEIFRYRRERERGLSNMAFMSSALDLIKGPQIAMLYVESSLSLK
jgi:hypothetical protein